TPTYALGCATLLFLSQLIALFTSSPAVVFNSNILALPLYICVFVYTELAFSLPFNSTDIASAPSDFVMINLKLHRTLCSLFFYTFIASSWFALFRFCRVSYLSFGVLVPFHLHLLTILIYLSRYSVYYLTGIYIVWLLLAFNLRYHAFDTMFPPALIVSPQLPQGSIILATYQTDHAVIVLGGQIPHAHSSLVSFFTFFLGRSTYTLYLSGNLTCSSSFSYFV
ncbi:hypothetical protein Tco_0866155, partial [Tanacetum coccineum]